jgi:uncharacterized protein (DUF433 family)
MSMASSHPPHVSKLTEKDFAGDLIQPGNPLFGCVWVNPQRMSGVACFTGTRVPIKTLFDYLEGGDSLDDFLNGFPPVTREQAVPVLEFVRSGLFALKS